MSDGRICFQCKAPDHHIPIPGDIDGQHFVGREIRYLRGNEDITPYLRSKGWIPHVFQGRKILWRYMCVNCLNENEVRDRVWDQLRDSAKKLEKPQKNHDADYYAQLCEVT